MNYKMVVLDLDGTLLNDEKIISKKNKEILKELHNRNIEIVIATGRNYYMAKELIDKIKDLKPVILANNGSIIRKSHNDELIDFNYLDPIEFERVYKEGLKRNLHPIIHVDEYLNGYDLIYELENRDEAYKGYIKKDYNRARLTKFKPEVMNSILSVCYFDEFDILSRFSEEIVQQGKGQINIICNRNLSERALLEFLHPEGCKWSALKKYASKWNISIEEIVALGDDNNDIEMLKNSGLGIAMANATDESKKASKKVSSYTNNNSGVYYELKDIFKI